MATYPVPATGEGHTRAFDVALVRTYSLLVRNEGPHPVVVQPELSPDRATWGSFGELPYLLEPGKKHLFVPQ